MKNICMIVLVTVGLNAWEINTHRAIDKIAINSASNLKAFIKNAHLNNTNFKNEILEGYKNKITGRAVTYFDYITNEKYSSDAIAGWKQTFINKNYKDLLEAGSILEDSLYPNTSVSFNGRFNNHFYDPQNGGERLVLGFGIRTNALQWAQYGAKIGTSIRDNRYSYNASVGYFLNSHYNKASVRRKYMAKMLVSVGYLLHMVNDMNVPAHVRNDMHPFDEPLEIWARGGENGNKSTGFRVKGNTVKDYSKLLKRNANKMVKYNNFDDFMTEEATWTATHFFSKDTVYTKSKPSLSDTYEFTNSVDDGVTKYYIKSGGTGNVGCNNGCVPVGTKLAIGIKSWILDKLEIYYPDRVLGKTTTFRGDYSVITENAEILIPRAIANATNFLNYFFRGQIKANITDHEITITNVSDPSLVAKDATIFRAASTYNTRENLYILMYEDENGVRHPLELNFNPEKDLSQVSTFWETPTDNHNRYLSTKFHGFSSSNDIKPGHSITIPIALDYDTQVFIRNKKIIVTYNGAIGTKIMPHQGHANEGIAICYASKPSGYIGHAHQE